MNPIGEPAESVDTEGARPAQESGDNGRGPDPRDPADPPGAGPAVVRRPAGGDRGAAPLG
ncbi:hypothetical protein [Actinoplanes subglobosus]|uniref:Uncharacterized protein n=1 Tax=Actinoplanes subglobosus TaxID=1547892 RepID=A0ABV8J572_9ACTN